MKTEEFNFLQSCVPNLANQRRQSKIPKEINLLLRVIDESELRQNSFHITDYNNRSQRLLYLNELQVLIKI